MSGSTEPKFDGATAAWLSAARGYVLDMDGVLYRGNQMIPEVPDFLNSLRRAGIPFAMATNNSTLSPAQYVTKLAGMGIDVEEHTIVTSGVATATYLKSRFEPGTRAYVVGMAALREAVFGDGYFEPATHGAEVVISGADFELVYESLKIACLCLRAGAAYVATNADVTYPSEEGLIPGSGTIVAALRACTGVEPVVVGKPGAVLTESAMEILGTEAALTVMLGDRLDTDILSGQAAGTRTVLVLTGVSDRAEMEQTGIRPDLVVDTLAELADFYTVLAGSGTGSLAMSSAYDVDDPEKIQGRDDIDLSQRNLATTRLARALDALAGIEGSVLILGAGAGRYPRALARYRPDLAIVAGDISPRAVAEAEARGGKITYLVLDAQRLPFVEDLFNAIVFFDVLEHVPQPERLLSECTRVLAPGGLLHFYVPLEDEPATLYRLLKSDRPVPIHRWKRDHVGHIQCFSRRDVLQAVWNAGLEVTQAEPSFHLVGQVHDIVDYWHRERQAGGQGVVPVRAVDLVTRATFLVTWRLAWVEDRLLHTQRFASGLHISARKPGELDF